MTRFFLIRHGERQLGHEVLVTRSPGIHLTEFGQRQAAAVAERLKSTAIDHIVSSPMERAQETAAPLARAKGLTVEVSAAFNEYEFGDWTKRTIPELAPDVRWQRFNSFRSGVCPPGGELMVEIQARFIRGLIELRERFSGKTVAIFSHGDPIRGAVMYFAGTPLDLIHHLEISLASITEIELYDDGVRIQRVNETPLPLSAT